MPLMYIWLFLVWALLNKNVNPIFNLGMGSPKVHYLIWHYDNNVQLWLLDVQDFDIMMDKPASY